MSNEKETPIIKAKPIAWIHENPDQPKFEHWHDGLYGFYIDYDSDDKRFSATWGWGESDLEHWDTLEEAKAGCQDWADRHVRSIVEVVSSSPKIIQILIGPDNAKYQGMLLGLDEEGVVWQYGSSGWVK